MGLLDFEPVHVIGDLVPESQFALISELHDRDRCKQFADAANAVDYEVYIIFHYLEKFATEPDENFIEKQVAWKAASGIEGNSVMLESKDFFLYWRAYHRYWDWHLE